MLSSYSIFCVVDVADMLWFAPEVIKRNQLASQKADVYSFGIILYEVIGKQGPFGKGYSYMEQELEGSYV